MVLHFASLHRAARGAHKLRLCQSVNDPMQRMFLAAPGCRESTRSLLIFLAGLPRPEGPLQGRSHSTSFSHDRFA